MSEAISQVARDIRYRVLARPVSVEGESPQGAAHDLQMVLLLNQMTEAATEVVEHHRRRKQQVLALTKQVQLAKQRDASEGAVKLDRRGIRVAVDRNLDELDTPKQVLHAIVPENEDVVLGALSAGDGALSAEEGELARDPQEMHLLLQREQAKLKEAARRFAAELQSQQTVETAHEAPNSKLSASDVWTARMDAALAGRAMVRALERMAKITRALATLEAGISAKLASEGRDAANGALSKAEQALSGAVAALVDFAEETGGDDLVPVGRSAHSEYFDDIADYLEQLGEEWMEKYGDALKEYMEFFTEFTDIMTMLNDLVADGGGDGQLLIDYGVLVKIWRELDSLIERYSGADGVLAQFDSLEEAAKFIDDMKLPDGTFECVQNPDGSFSVKLNMENSPVALLRDLMYSELVDFDGLWDPAKLQAFMAAKDSLVQQLEHVSQVMAEKYSRVVQLFDNLVRVLSSAIETIGEADRTFMRNLV